ncbi:sulfite oxidase [Halorarius halobius]|uniref:sulfite oxidase n=1 Tax=Halorarius halobius TaxID=2962671 RepID=UPI0020CC3052|nr:sulfite oxidase [Halorarius halobius]
MPDDTTPSTRERYLERRRFLLAAGAGSALLAGCGQPQETGTPTGTASPAPESPTATGTATETEPETPGEDQPSLEERYPGLRILSPEPENAEAAARDTYTTLITPLEEFYIRNHYPTPDIQESEWTVSLTGAFDQEADLSMQELKEGYSTETVFHVMQCSGNGRSYFQPQVGGNQWTFGAVGNAEWTGTPVSDVLEAYGADTSDGMWVSFMGGEAPDGEDIFTRSIPMSKAMDDCLLAYEMNGETLVGDHGFPVRLVVPGWYGNNNVKWVSRMHVMDMMVYGDEWETDEQRLYTHWQQYSYRIIPEEDDEAEQYESIDIFDTYEQMQNPDRIRNAYVNDQLVKSLIGYPGEDSTVSRRADGTIEVLGTAWAGDNAVETVEVSDDGGETWGDAEFMAPDLGTDSWRLFRYVWEPEPGEYTLYSRATDAMDRTQPATVSAPEEQLRGIQDDQFPWNQDGYINNAYEPHGVTVTVE